MAKSRQTPLPPPEPREFRSSEEVDACIAKLQRRVKELEQLDIVSAYRNDSGEDKVAISNVRDTIRDVFGVNSPEFQEHQGIQLWAGGFWLNMSDSEFVNAKERGRIQTIGILKGLIGRLEEKKQDLASGAVPAPSTYFDRLNLHPRIADVARDLFMDGHHWEAVFSASKALVNFVKERSGRHDLDGANLMRTVFSRSNPVLAFNDAADQTQQDEQEGTMHLLEGAVLAIRNPGGHSFPEGSEQRAIEYISLLSLLCYRVQEAKRRKTL